MSPIRRHRAEIPPIHAQRLVINYSTSSSLYFEEIIKDLLSNDAGMDCVVSYFEMLDNDINKEDIRNELQDTQLVVLCVTVEILQRIATGIWPEEYLIARELRLPILPILQDDELFDIYKERFGSIHCISTSDKEYRNKLKFQLEVILPSEEFISEVRTVFTSTLFVSYRKKEVDKARRFMKVFHDFEGFEAISIWYDNYLTAGRDFEADIKTAIQNAVALTIMITPLMLKEDNYITRTEYPFAKEIGKCVIPVEIDTISFNLFTEKFPGLENPVSLENTNVLRSKFVEKIGEPSLLSRMDDKQAYLLGMAYLKNIGVERDFDRAVKLLELSSSGYSNHSLSASKQLVDIYNNGAEVELIILERYSGQKESQASVKKCLKLTVLTQPHPIITSLLFMTVLVTILKL